MTGEDVFVTAMLAPVVVALFGVAIAAVGGIAWMILNMYAYASDLRRFKADRGYWSTDEDFRDWQHRRDRWHRQFEPKPGRRGADLRIVGRTKA